MRTHWHNLSFSLAVVMILPGCKSLPAIPLTTPQPLEVNLNMRLDVYQYRGDEPQDKEAVKTLAEATERQRNRMSEVQTIKDNRFIGEDHRGLLQLREVPAGDWGDYVKRTIDAENEDRMLLPLCGVGWYRIPVRRKTEQAFKRQDDEGQGCCACDHPSERATHVAFSARQRSNIATSCSALLLMS